jgi:putative NADH-flavin reductase
MHIAVLGASGRTGVPFVRQALEAGHHVTALSRSKSKLESKLGAAASTKNLRIVEGDATDHSAVSQTLEGAEAVALALGHAKGSPDDVLQTATRHVLAVAPEGVRLVNVTGAGVPDEQDPPPTIGDRVMKKLLGLVAGKLLRDSIVQDQLLRESRSAWTSLRAPRLLDGNPTGQYRIGYIPLGFGAQIDRADVAKAMLDLIEQGGYEREAPRINGPA